MYQNQGLSGRLWWSNPGLRRLRRDDQQASGQPELLRPSMKGLGKLSQVVVHKDTEKTFLLKLQMPAWAGSVAEAGPLRRVLVRSHMFFLGKVALPALTDNVNESAITMRYEKDSMGQERGTHIGCTLLQKPILVQLWVVKNNESHEASTAVCHSPAKLSLVLFSSLFCLLLQVSDLYVLHL